MNSFNVNLLLKVPSPNTGKMGVRASMDEFGVGTQVSLFVLGDGTV